MQIDENEEKIKQIEDLKLKEDEYTNRLEEFEDQINVLTEERDAMEQGLQTSWQEKAQLQEDLDGLQNSYVSVTQRLNDERDLREDTEEQLQQYKQLVEQYKNKASQQKWILN